MSAWMALALAIIVAGGFAILAPAAPARVAVGFWLAFAAGDRRARARRPRDDRALAPRPDHGPSLLVGARHLTRGPRLPLLHDHRPEDGAAGARARDRLRASALGLLAALLIAPTRTEFAAKVALLGALAIVCLARPLLRTRRSRVRRARRRSPRRPASRALRSRRALRDGGARRDRRQPLSARQAPADRDPARRAACRRSSTRRTAELIAHGLITVATGARAANRSRCTSSPATDQIPATAVAQVARRDLPPAPDAVGALDAAPPSRPTPSTPRPVERASSRARDSSTSRSRSDSTFTQGSFRFGVSNDSKAMMGGGVCWLDYNSDGRLDLFAVNSYVERPMRRVGQRTAGCRRSALFENVGGRFRERDAADARRARSAGRRLRRGRPQRRRTHRSRRHDDERRRRPLERRRDVPLAPRCPPRTAGTPAPRSPT